MKSFIVFISLVLILFITSCGGKQTEVPKETNAISDSLINTLSSAPVTAEDACDIIKLNGKIEPNETKLAKVYALISGKIESANVELGDYVRKGQVLAVLRSTEVAGSSNDLSLAAANVEMAKKSLETTKDLYDGKLATEQDYITAKINYNKALSELSRAQQVASITGGKSSVYTVTAPLSGYVIEKNITNNSAVRPDNSADLFAIADLSSVWIIANVYEADMGNIHLGDAVKVSTLAYSDKEYSGKIDKIYNVLDPATRTMKVRISMDNRDNELKPEMFAIVKVNGKPSGKQLSIPAESIIMDNSKNYVIVKKGKTLEVRTIDVIKRIDNKAFIQGLSEGEQVVTAAELFLYQALTTK